MSKLIKNGEEWVHSETGELYTKKQLENLNNKKLLEEHGDYYKNAIDHEIKPTLKLVKLKEPKESTMKTVKEGYKFNMMHRTDIKDLLLSNELTVQEFAFIGAFTPFVTYPYNDLKVNNEYLTLDDLAEFCGYSKNIMTRTIKKLEELQVIKVVKGGNRPPIIYFNPFLYSAGREVSTETFNLFCQSKYNPDVANYQ
jgi:hypothetical protein